MTGGRDGTVRFWEARSGRPAHAPVAMESGVVWGVAVRPSDGSIAVAAGAPENAASGAGKASWLVLLDAGTLAVKSRYFAHSEDTTSVAFSPDGSSIVTGGADDALRRRALAGDASQSVRMVGHSGNIQSVAFSADGRYIASASVDKTVRLWLAATGQALGGPLGGHDEAVTSVVFSPDGQWLASASDDGRLVMGSLDPSWSTRVAASGGRGAGYASAVGAIAPDGTAGLFVRDGALRHHNHDRDLFDPANVPGPPFFACSGSSARPAQPASRNRRGGDPFSTAALPPAAYAPDGRSFVSGRDDGSLHRWDTATWQPVGKPIAASSCAIDAVAWSADGRVIVAASRDRPLVFDAHRGTAVATSRSATCGARPRLP